MSIEKYKRLLEQPLIVLDIETTGFYFDSGDEIVELAAEKLVLFFSLLYFSINHYMIL